MNDDEFEQALTDTAAGRGPASAHRDALSNLSPEQLPRFRAVWGTLEERQKLALLQSLADAEYDTLRLDFSEIYHLGMVDESAEVRRMSVESTVEDDSRWLLERLLNMVAHDQEADVRAAAAEGLIELIDDPALPVRLAAIAALGEIGGQEAREALVYALEDELEAVREAAEAALEEIDFFEDPLGS